MIWVLGIAAVSAALLSYLGRDQLRRLRALRVVRIDWPWPALELVRPDGSGWLVCRLPRGRDAK